MAIDYYKNEKYRMKIIWKISKMKIKNNNKNKTMFLIIIVLITIIR